MALFVNAILWHKFSIGELKGIRSKATDVLDKRNGEPRDQYWNANFYDNYAFVDNVNWEVLTDSDLRNLLTKVNKEIDTREPKPYDNRNYEGGFKGYSNDRLSPPSSPTRRVIYSPSQSPPLSPKRESGMTPPRYRATSQSPPLSPTGRRVIYSPSIDLPLSSNNSKYQLILPEYRTTDIPQQGSWRKDNGWRDNK